MTTAAASPNHALMACAATHASTASAGSMFRLESMQAICPHPQSLDRLQVDGGGEDRLARSSKRARAQTQRFSFDQSPRPQREKKKARPAGQSLALVAPREVQPWEAKVDLEVDVKYDDGRVWRGKLHDVKKPKEDKAVVVIRFGDPRLELHKHFSGDDNCDNEPWDLPNPNVTFPGEDVACPECGLTRPMHERRDECESQFCKDRVEMSEPVTTGKRSVQMDLDPSPIAQSPPTVMVAGAAGGSNFEAGSSPLLGYAGVDLFQVGQVGQEGAKLIDEELRAKQQERREESDRLSDEERELQVLKPTVEGMKQQLGDYSASSDKITSELRDLEGEMKSKRIEQARLEGQTEELQRKLMEKEHVAGLKKESVVYRSKNVRNLDEHIENLEGLKLQYTRAKRQERREESDRCVLETPEDRVCCNNAKLERLNLKYYSARSVAAGQGASGGGGVE